MTGQARPCQHREPAPPADANLRAFSPTKTSSWIGTPRQKMDPPAGRSLRSVRYSETLLPRTSASLVTDETPIPGTTQTMTVNALDPTTHYYFSIISRDEVGRISPFQIAELNARVLPRRQGSTYRRFLAAECTEITPLTVMLTPGFGTRFRWKQGGRRRRAPIGLHHRMVSLQATRVRSPTIEQPTFDLPRRSASSTASSRRSRSSTWRRRQTASCFYGRHRETMETKGRPPSSLLKARHLNRPAFPRA